MDYSEWRQRGKEMVDYIADYLETIRERRVFPDVKPGYMRDLVPPRAPTVGEPWNDVMADVERVIMPGVTHWQSPYMHAYFPALNSPASMLGDMLANAIGCLGFTWASSPACTELEMIVMDWLGQMIGLPDEFLHKSKDTHGGGVIQTTASEATFVSLLAGRTDAIQKYKKTCPDLDDAEINSRLVAYTSDQAHSSVEKAGLIGLVKMRYIETDDNLSLRGDRLVEMIRRDRQKGLIPFFLCATLGSTGACAFDNIRELGPICRSEGLWMHVDAAYAGTAFICPEFRHWLTGIEFADSLAFNPSKWMMVHFDCTAMWVKNSQMLHRTFNVDPLYLQHENTGYAIDYMHWQIPLSKRFRALKLWFVIRSYGVEGLQAHIREGVRLAGKFEEWIRSDDRFEVAAARHLGLICFRLRGENELTEKLLKRLNSNGKLHCVPSSLKGIYVIRFTVTSTHTRLEDLSRDWLVIQTTAQQLLAQSVPAAIPAHKKVMLADTRRNTNFGTSLLLVNTHMSPRIVDASYAAFIDNGDVLTELTRKLNHLRTNLTCNSPALRKRVRGMLMSGKQFSLDSRIDIKSFASCAEGESVGVPNDDGTKMEHGCQTPSRWKRSSSMVTADDGGAVRASVAGTIEEDDEESDDDKYEQRIRETVARNACRNCGSSIWVK